MGDGSHDNVVDAMSHFVAPQVTHTVSKFMETPFDFLSHPGCKRNMSYDDMHDEVVSRGEGIVLEKENGVVLCDTGKFTGLSPSYYDTLANDAQCARLVVAASHSTLRLALKHLKKH
jgi:hypothetical protein